MQGAANRMVMLTMLCDVWRQGSHRGNTSGFKVAMSEHDKINYEYVIREKTGADGFDRNWRIRLKFSCEINLQKVE